MVQLVPLVMFVELVALNAGLGALLAYAAVFADEEQQPTDSMAEVVRTGVQAMSLLVCASIVSWFWGSMSLDARAKWRVAAVVASTLAVLAASFGSPDVKVLVIRGTLPVLVMFLVSPKCLLDFLISSALVLAWCLTEIVISSFAWPRAMVYMCVATIIWILAVSGTMLTEIVISSFAWPGAMVYMCVATIIWILGGIMLAVIVVLNIDERVEDRGDAGEQQQ